MSMFKLLPSLAAALAVVSVLSVAHANEPGIPRSERLFGRLDANADGRLAIDEMRPKAERRFMRLDTDEDGKVTTAEIETWLRKMQDRRRDRILEAPSPRRSSTPISISCLQPPMATMMAA